MESILNSLADFLVRQSLQVGVVFLLVACACWMLRAASAHWRYLLWLLVVAKCLTPPIVSLSLPVLSSKPTAAVATEALPRTSLDASHSRALAAHDSPRAAKAEAAPPMPTAPPQSLARKFNAWTWLAVVWLAGFSICIALIVSRISRTSRRLHQTRLPAESAVQALVAETASQLGIRIVPNAYITEAAGQPFVWGWVVGDIYLPLGFDQIGNAAQRRNVLAHELAHVARWDVAVNLVQLAVQSIFFFHPLVWWANKAIRLEREKCCDEVVLSNPSWSPRQYCEAIVEVVARTAQHHQPAPVLAVGGHLEAIEERIATILTPQRRFQRRPSWLFKGAAVAVGCCLLPTAVVLTSSAQTAERVDGAERSERSTAVEKDEWRKGQQIAVRVVDSQTQEPLSEVALELQNWGEGIDFQDIKEYTTDSDGRAVLDLPDLPPTAVRIYPTKDGYVPLRVYWEGTPWATVPASITIPLERGKAFGGVVKNESGEVVPGVAVMVHYWATGTGENPHIRANLDSKATTDEQGRWSIKKMPAEFEEDDLRIYFSHPDYVSDHLRRGHLPLPVYTEVPIRDYVNQTAITTLRRGDDLWGQVVDEDGKPVVGATIHLNAQYFWAKDKPRAKTDERGEFRVGGVEIGEIPSWLAAGESPMYVTVQAAGYAPEMVGVNGPGSIPKVTLQRGHTVRGRVLDESGKPVEGVSIIGRKWRGQRDRLGVGMKSRADGSFELTDLPADVILYDFSKSGYMFVNDFVMTPAKSDYVVTMRPPLRVTGTVIDADTGEPIDQFALIHGIDYEDGRAPEWLRYETTQVRGGKFETAFDQEEIRWRLRVEAAGYLPGESRIFRLNQSDTGEIVNDFKLQKAEPISDTVLNLDGKPLAGAAVYLATQLVSVDNREIDNQEGSLAATSDEAGRFTFPPEVEPFCLVAVHPDGIALATEKDFAQSPDLKIKPWTASNQRLQIVRRPARGQWVDFPPPVEKR